MVALLPKTTGIIEKQDEEWMTALHLIASEEYEDVTGRSVGTSMIGSSENLRTH